MAIYLQNQAISTHSTDNIDRLAWTDGRRYIPGMIDLNTLYDFDLRLTWTVEGQAKSKVGRTIETGLTGYPGLAVAIIRQAVIDASTGDLDAVEWLRGEECAFYCEALGFDHNVIRAWINERWEGCFWYMLPGRGVVIFSSSSGPSMNPAVYTL